DSLGVMISRELWTHLFPYTTLFRSCVLCRLELRRALRGRRESAPSCAGDARASRILHESAYSGKWAVCGRAGSSRRHRETRLGRDRKSTRLNSSHVAISYAVFCLKK